MCRQPPCVTEFAEAACVEVGDGKG